MLPILIPTRKGVESKLKLVIKLIKSGMKIKCKLALIRLPLTKMKSWLGGLRNVSPSPGPKYSLDAHVNNTELLYYLFKQNYSSFPLIIKHSSNLCPS